MGKDVESFRLHDEVFGFTGLSRGAYAEYKCVSRKEIANGEMVLKPTNKSHEEAVAVLYGATLAIHFMRDANIKKGQKVLVYGASGAIGTIAVQLANMYGAEVTGVCSSKNFDLIRSLGAHKTLDYMKEDSIHYLEEYDFILDAVGKNKSSKLKTACKKTLTKQGKYISVDDGLLAIQPDYLKTIKALIEAGHIEAVIDKTFPLEKIVEAHRYIDTGHKAGNVVLLID